MSWGCFIFCLLEICLFFHPAKKHKAETMRQHGKEIRLAEIANHQICTLLGIQKERWLRKGCKAKKALTRFICHLRGRKEQTEINTRVRRQKEWTGVYYRGGPFSDWNLQDFAETDMVFERVYVISVLGDFTCTVRQPQLGPCPSKTMQEVPRSTKIMASFDVFSKREVSWPFAHHLHVLEGQNWDSQLWEVKRILLFLSG